MIYKKLPKSIPMLWAAGPFRDGELGDAQGKGRHGGNRMKSHCERRVEKWFK